MLTTRPLSRRRARTNSRHSRRLCRTRHDSTSCLLGRTARNRDTKDYASVVVKLSMKGGLLCIPEFGGFGGTMQYPSAVRAREHFARAGDRPPSLRAGWKHG